MALCLTYMENILCYFTLISCNKISWWNLVFILRDLGEKNGWEEIKFSDSLQLGKFISSPCYKEKKFVNSMEIQRTSLLFTVNLWLLNFFQFDRTLLDFFLFFQVIDVSLLGGAKNNASQGTNVCTLWCCHIDVPDIFYVIYSF